MNQSTHTYKYPVWLRCAYVGQTVTALLMGIFAITLTMLDIAGTLDPQRVHVYYPVLGLIIGVLVILVGFGISAYDAEIIVTPSGLKVKVFFLFWVAVDWSDMMGFVVFDPRSVKSDARYWHGIRFRRLSICHTLFSLFQNTGRYPVLLVNYRLSNVDELLRIFEAQLQIQETDT